MTRHNLLETMRKLRLLVDAEGPAPQAEPVDWTIPRRLHREAVESLTLFAAKLAGRLEKCLDLLAGQIFEVTVESIREDYAERMFDDITQQQPNAYYVPLLQTGQGHVGFISLPFETAATLVGFMLRDPDAEIGKDGQMSSLEESILLDAASAIAEALINGFGEYGRNGLEKTEQLVHIDWPVRFHNLEDVCCFAFKAVVGQKTLTWTLTIRDEIIADIASLEGPFGAAEENRQESDRIVKRMHETPMHVAALLSTSLMTLNDLLTLEEGDVVVLDRKITEPIDMMVNGQKCFCAWPATHAGRRAVLAADEKGRLL